MAKIVHYRGEEDGTPATLGINIVSDNNGFARKEKVAF